MDLFLKEPGPLYVPAFAGRLLLSMAKGIARAGETLKQSLMNADAEGMWTLSLVVVQWYADRLPTQESGAVAAALQGVSVAGIASNLNLFREQLLPFVRTAHQAQNDAQLAAAGVYFVSAVEQLGPSMLQSAIQAGPVRALQQQILARLPLPRELRSEYDRAIGRQSMETPARPAASPRSSRADRFDRADYSPRQVRTPPPAQPAQRLAQARTPPRSSPAATAPLRPPTPILAQADVTRAYLYTLGWEGEEVERLLAGPDDKKRA